MQLCTLIAGVAFLVAPACAATLIHHFPLQNSLADVLAGPSLVSYGGTLSPSGYAFGANQGLTLSNPFLDTASYSIQIRFQYDGLSGYQKIIDFSDLQEVAGTDPGLYALDARLTYYNAAISAGAVFSPGVLVDVVLTRDSGGNAEVYVNGFSSFSFFDNGSSSRAQLTTPTTPLWLFVDDYHSLQTEAGPGEVSLIRIWDGVLTPSEVEQVSVPEPSATLLVAAGLVVVVLKGRQKRSRRPWSCIST